MKLKEVVDKISSGDLAGDAAINALATFPYSGDTPSIKKPKDDSDRSRWWQEVEDKPLGGPDSWDALTLAHLTGKIPDDIYKAARDKRQSGKETPQP